MKIRMGIATEYARHKFDIEVDDEDWELLVRQYQIPAALAATVTPQLKYLALNSLCNWLLKVEAARIEPAPGKGPAQEAAAIAGQAHRDVMAMVTNALGVQVQSEPAAAAG
jgi:hypothetical protein